MQKHESTLLYATTKVSNYGVKLTKSNTEPPAIYSMTIHNFVECKYEP